MVLQGYDIHSLRSILEDVEYDIELLHEEGADFLGLGIVLSSGKLHVVFRSDDDMFDSDVSPWTLYLPEDEDVADFKVGYIEEYVVYNLIDIFRSCNDEDLKVEINNDLTSLKIYNNSNETILDYCM